MSFTLKNFSRCSRNSKLCETATLGQWRRCSTGSNSGNRQTVLYIQPCLYLIGHDVREIEKREMERMLAKAVIEPAEIKWLSPIVYEAKEDGTLRFCIEYRELNSVTISDLYTILHMDSFMNSLGDATTFSTWHAKFPIPAGRNRRAASRKDGIHLQPRLISFYTNDILILKVLGMFTRAMNVLLTKVKWLFALVYLHDIGIFLWKKVIPWSMFDKFWHCRTMRAWHLFWWNTNSSRTDLTTSAMLFSQSVSWCWHRRSKQWGDSTTQPTWQNLNHSLGFLTCLGFRLSVPSIARFADSLNNKSQKCQPQTFDGSSHEEGTALKHLKVELMEPPVLSLPRSQGNYMVSTDSRNK